jgi:glutaminase
MSTTSQHPVFRALDSQATGFISAEQILDKLAHGGIAAGDPRVVALREGLREVEDSQRINPEDFGALLQRAPSIVERVVKEELVIPQFANFAACIEDLHRECRKNRHGDVASYIPQLARVEPEQFGVAVCTIDGQRLTLGEADVPFSFQSSCKPILYCAALEEHGEDRVHRHIGREPSGFSFNELTLDKNGRPHNPMINAGAIISTSLLRPDLAMGERFDYLSHLVAALSGGSKPGFNNSMYHSERETADRNFALAHYMRELGAFPAGTDIFRTLDLYFGACSIETNATDMATVAATFANGGICPQSGERHVRIFGRIRIPRGRAGEIVRVRCHPGRDSQRHGHRGLVAASRRGRQQRARPRLSAATRCDFQLPQLRQPRRLAQARSAPPSSDKRIQYHV